MVMTALSALTRGPQSSRCREIELLFARAAGELGMRMADIDALIWRHQAGVTSLAS